MFWAHSQRSNYRLLPKISFDRLSICSNYLTFYLIITTFICNLHKPPGHSSMNFHKLDTLAQAALRSVNIVLHILQNAWFCMVLHILQKAPNIFLLVSVPTTVTTPDFYYHRLVLHGFKFYVNRIK